MRLSPPSSTGRYLHDIRCIYVSKRLVVTQGCHTVHGLIRSGRWLIMEGLVRLDLVEHPIRASPFWEHMYTPHAGIGTRDDTSKVGRTDLY